ncbi:hypothetical protein RJ639_043030 [Escallonia herrerae]|uniref:G-patch domain-containing protein n=1 Tax=Escallonia herrerae TaxID=1293975 RepID=A0AA88WCZ4_9ASTE|nr:hypothetical protein RJ639_043030 [Escallonia herrerae]
MVAYLHGNNPVFPYPFTSTSGMMADPKIQSMMARWGFVAGCGLGREGQGMTDPLSPHRNEFRFGLGYKPTAEDWDREQAKAARVARLREKVSKLICDSVECDDEDYLAELQEKWLRHEEVKEYTDIPDLSNLSLLEEPEEYEEDLDVYYEDWVLC